MKANQKFRNDRAEVGVGTLIVFIAMVLVAAVAAAVLINTTGTLQQRAQATGKEATQEVSSNLKVVNVYGIVDTSKVDQLRVNVQLAAGAQDIDLEQLVLRFADGTNTLNYAFTDRWDDGGACDGAGTQIEADGVGIVEVSYILHWLRPAADATNDHGCTGKSVMEAGDLVEIRIALTAGKAIDVRKSIEVSLIPEAGAPVQADFRTPATYGGDTYVTLR